MPSTSSLTPTEKSLVKKYSVPSNSDKILTVALGRIYYSYPSPTKWSFSGVFGAIVFGWTKGGEGWLRVIDLAGTRGIIWQHRITEDIDYYQDRTFFHTFASDECMIGISFSSESEASTLFQKISQRSKWAKKYSASSNASTTVVVKKGKKGGIDKSMIGSPSGFSHVAHMGFDVEKGFSSTNVDPSWERLLSQLESQGVSRSQIEKNESFIRNYVKGSGGPPPITSKRVAPPAPPSRGLPVNKKTAPAPPVSRSGTTIAPPPPPPPMSSPAFAQPKSRPPVSSLPPPPPLAPTPAPPPIQTRSPVALPPPIAPRANIPPPPIAPVARQPQAPPPPPPPPSARGPPAPPAPPIRSAVPPPPAPPTPIRAAIPSPPSSPPPAPSSTAPPPARANLLAAIQGGGLSSLKKSNPAPVAVVASPIVEDESAGGLASALAAALGKRKGNMGADSDDEDDEESDAEWD